MTVGEAKFLDWAFVLLGAMLFFGGWRLIHKHRVQTDTGEYVGRRAVLLGWLWLCPGLLLILATLTDIAFLKTFDRPFLESPS
jgi:hypothetical protein